MKHLYLLLSLFTIAISQGQTPDTLYVFKARNLVIKQSIKPVDIDSITFKRSPTIAATTAATSITPTTGISGGNITSDGGSTITARGVCWSTTANPTTSDFKTTDTGTIGTFTSNLTSLTAGTLYYVRAYAKNAVNTVYGTQISFTTLVLIDRQQWMPQNLEVASYRDGTPIPQVTDPATWAGLTTGAWCYYNNTSTNGTTYGKLYNWYAVAGIHDTDAATANKTLAPTGYHVPSDAEWTTLTTYLGGVGEAGGKMKNTIGWSNWNVGFFSYSGNGSNSSGFTGLPAGYRDYYTGSFAELGSGCDWWISTAATSTTAGTRALNSNVANVTIANYYKTFGFSVRCLRDLPPTIAATTAATSITATTGISGGNITSDGESTITARGVCWSRSANPTTSDFKTTDTTGTTGTFTGNLTSLTAGTLYYVRAYATNAVNTVYGTQISFTTLTPPTIAATTAATIITSTTGISGGNITSDGGSTITARGVCWSRSENPTTSDSKTTDTTGTTGAFTSNLTGLTAGTLYYVRAYATSAANTVYGTQISFTTTIVAVGDSYQGGIVAYILQPGDPGYNPNLQQGLVATVADISGGVTWGCSGTLIAGADGTAIGTGNQNTIDIMAGCATVGIAARLCGNLIQGGYSDWYLPSKDELNKLYLNKNVIGGFASGGYYWSSTEYNATDAYPFNFTNGYAYDSYKAFTNSVRAVRAF